MNINTRFKIFILIAFTLCITFKSQAQIDESYRYTYADFDTTASNKLYFRLESNNFVKNNEYFGEYVQGYTVPGYTVQPSLMYYAGKNIRLKIGAHLLKYSGLMEFTEIVPVITAHAKLGKNWDMILGNIKGDVHHRLIEPLFNSEWQYYHAQETGVQFCHESKKLWFDSWLDWEQFIFDGDTVPEIFTAGVSLDYSIKPRDSRLNVSIPFQMTANHLGGQISDYKMESYSLINLVTGLKLSQLINGSFIRKLDFAAYVCTYNDLTDAKALPFSSGIALYPTATLTYKNGQIMAGYWNASDYYAPKGNALFFSVSDRYDDYYKQSRQIITTKFTYNKTLMKQVKFRVQADTYYDIDASELEYSYGISLVFTPNFYISKLDFD